MKEKLVELFDFRIFRHYFYIDSNDVSQYFWKKNFFPKNFLQLNTVIRQANVSEFT